MKRFLWDHAIPQQVHTPSSFGPAVILKTTDTWVSSLKWPGYCNSWNTQVIRAEPAQIKWRPNPPTTKVYKFIFTCFAFIVFEKSEFWFPEAAKPQPDFLSLVAEVKWQFRDWNDSLTLSPVSQPYRFDPEGSQQNLAESDAPPAWTASCICLRANATLRQRLQTPGSLCTYALMLGSAGTDADYVINYLF